MGSSRTTVAVGGRRILVFLPPEDLDALAEKGCARSRLAYIGCDRDYETEALEEMGLADAETHQELDDFEGLAVDASAAEEPDPFYDWQGCGSANDADQSDPHEDLLQRIGALSMGGKR